MRIVLLVEGDTERACMGHLKRFLDARADGRPKVGLQASLFHGGLDPRGVRGRAEQFLRDSSVVAVVALVDVYPDFKTGADDAKKTVQSWFPADSRCVAHVAKHDFEAWLLFGWEALVKQSGVRSAPRPFGKRPEEINHDNPPAHRLRSLFLQGERKYKKPIDGKKLFERLDLEAVAGVCPELKAFLNTLLRFAKYPALP
ncbi:MAG TPA: DUF4276 family protein [Pseudomonadota bacterium]|nr:DUF4276 family protein [Pseudomonadota bacterium]